jgi:hypothetical protein
MTELASPPARAEDRAGTKRIKHWIDGAAVDGTSGRSGPVYNPATGAVQAQVDLASVEEVDRAVAAAGAAVPDGGRDGVREPLGGGLAQALLERGQESGHGLYHSN